MDHREPPGHLAPHIPADLYRRAEATGQPVVFVIQDNTAAAFPWRRLLLPFAIAGAAALGTWGVVAALCWLMDVASHTATVIAGAAGPVGAGGITIKLFSKK
ncbi:hypothetical protein GCM10022403_039110 [Streptomyces coacervatus]|uniref:Uncharacterized protein n=1 Tax=Streptomyces coacervatus TaxID=647381 RepID=A0ABP7HPA8_9ACTN|nr:hypothetical protein [Streptomyces coacervatus]MDF2270682.1 hypothetical protein [Streptomyces coacervatus]